MGVWKTLDEEVGSSRLRKSDLLNKNRGRSTEHDKYNAQPNLDLMDRENSLKVIDYKDN